MSIPFTCDCGKSMSAKEEFAGRRLRCPECKRVVVIPRRVPPTDSATSKPPKAKRPPTLARPANRPPTLTAAELASLSGAPPTVETPPPSNTLPIRSAENLAALFAPSTPPPPALAPKVAPVVGARVEPPVTPATTTIEPATNAGHPWIDRSMEQIATPWLSGDEARYQTGVARAPERDDPFGWFVPAVAIAGAIAAAIYLP